MVTDPSRSISMIESPDKITAAIEAALRDINARFAAETPQPADTDGIRKLSKEELERAVFLNGKLMELNRSLLTAINEQTYDETRFEYRRVLCEYQDLHSGTRPVRQLPVYLLVQTPS